MNNYDWPKGWWMLVLAVSSLQPELKTTTKFKAFVAVTYITLSTVSSLFCWNMFSCSSLTRCVLMFVESCCIVWFAVELPLYFPSEHPRFTFQSVYHEVKGQPYSEVVTNFPYSPRWNADEMASRAKWVLLTLQHTLALSLPKLLRCSCSFLSWGTPWREGKADKWN